jgi:integrase
MAPEMEGAVRSKCRWIPLILSEQDRLGAADLEERYGVDDGAIRSFHQRYLQFAATNQLDPKVSATLILAIGQARAKLAMSTLCTYVLGMLAFYPIQGAYRVKAMITAAHAGAAPVRPKATTWPEEDLLRCVNTAAETEDQVILWLLLATGARAADIFHLTFQQVLLKEESLTVSWWVTKATRHRGGRHEATYPFAWSMPPPTKVRTYLSKGTPNHGILPINISHFKKKNVAAHVTRMVAEVRSDLTSYVFRTRMEKTLESEGIADNELKRLLDHTAQTSEAFYKGTTLSAATNERVRSENARSRAAKKATMQTTKKTLSTRKK